MFQLVLPFTGSNPARKAELLALQLLIFLSGVAALSWEVLWQVKSSLALGVSAWGTALTLATMMGGMSLGAALMSQHLRHATNKLPLVLYGGLEVVIGLAGLCMGQGFMLVEQMDSWIYRHNPAYATVTHIVGIICVLGIPTICMGATIPVLSLIARQYKTSVAVLYSMNTLGAATGVLVVAFALIPNHGIEQASYLVAALNIAVGIIFVGLNRRGKQDNQIQPVESSTNPSRITRTAALVVGVTGFATFALEIAWFRALTAALKSTTDAFAIMLAAVLIALGIAARLVNLLKQSRVSLSSLIVLAGVLILVATPLIERFDYVYELDGGTSPSLTLISRFIITLLVLAPSVTLLGLALPWTLDDYNAPKDVGILYALNTLAAIAGSVGTAWLLLPIFGFVHTAWLAGGVVAVTGLMLGGWNKRYVTLSASALLLSVACKSDVGTVRAPGQGSFSAWGASKVIELYEGPQSTLSITDYENGNRMLVIDGSPATGQPGPKANYDSRYMLSMGHLPMLLHPAPSNALVICFGTGQTANAVRHENPSSLDIVDINPQVFALSHYFSANDQVLSDARVTAIAMDGRAYVRRTQKLYDVITLEPMPPVLAGVNALYSQEFYRQARNKLTAQGVMAQWLPFHTATPHFIASIAKTFQSVFPNAILWIDHPTKNGILLGSKDDATKLGGAWPGFMRQATKRSLTKAEAEDMIALDAAALSAYSADGDIVTDNNQKLAYGAAVNSMYYKSAVLVEENFRVLHASGARLPSLEPTQSDTP